MLQINTRITTEREREREIKIKSGEMDLFDKKNSFTLKIVKMV